MISLEQHEKRVEGLNARILALEAQLLEARKEVNSLQETVRANAEEKMMTRKRNQQIMKRVEKRKQQEMEARKRIAEEEEKQYYAWLQQVERLDKAQLEKNLPLAENQSEHYMTNLQWKRRRDEYNRKALEEMAELDRREGPQQFAKYRMVEATVLEELLDIKVEHNSQKKRIGQLQKLLQLKDQQISRLKTELDTAMEQVRQLQVVDKDDRLLKENQSLKKLLKKLRKLFEQYQCTERVMHKQGGKKDETGVTKASNRITKQL